ncbi:hypothetical protein [Sphingomonas oleivorans]|uniref:hypothetical protein n=1 Tax=Sphingomonas oleivorans TaxID=1735121 RepID=UPI0013FD9388|nr:hypothetical protein [Sphingomonas oleivorans]
MAKPPKTPPSSDIKGVDMDRKPINRPENSDPEMGRRFDQEHREAKGRPAPSRP